MSDRTFILDKKDLQKKIKRLAFEIVENNIEETEIVLAGILPNGLTICNLLKTNIADISTIQVHIITIDINKREPQKIVVNSKEDFQAKSIIIVDDVSMTGRTILYALKPFLEYYPKKIQTLVLVERQQKSFPIHSDFVGLHISTTLQELIIVEQENNALTGVYLK